MGESVGAAAPQASHPGSSEFAAAGAEDAGRVAIPVLGGAAGSSSILAALADARSRRAPHDVTGDDVPDSVNRPVEAHEEAAELIVAALLPILRRVADLVTAGAAGPVGRAMITGSRSRERSSASPAA